MNESKLFRLFFFICLAASLAAHSSLCIPAHGGLQFFYDPLTGNVSLDTSATRNGSILSYSLGLNPHASDIRFRTDNLIRLSNSTFVTNRTLDVGEGFVSQPLAGFYTIGDILPTGLSEDTWGRLFADVFFKFGIYRPTDNELGDYTYSDVLGGGTPPTAEFIYGRPDREFDNSVDLIDPETLKWADAATIIYHAQTGELFLDTTDADSGYTTGILLQSEGAFLADNFIPVIDSPLTSASTDTLFQVADLIEPGVYNLGEVLPAGMMREQFESTFSNARFLSRAGFSGGSLDFAIDGLPVSFSYIQIPEPITALLVLIGTLGSTLMRLRVRLAAVH